MGFQPGLACHLKYASTVQVHFERRLMFKWTAALIVAALGLGLGWHYYLVGDIRREAEASAAKTLAQGGKETLTLNPINDVLRLTIVLPPADDDKAESAVNPGSQPGKGLAQGLSKLAEPLIEHEMNTKARETFDLYAWVLPYRVHVSVEDPDAKTIADYRAKRAANRETEKAKQRAAEEQRREKFLPYIQQGMTLERVRVAQVEKYGRQVEGVFGTVVNRGDKTLNEVTVRVYFLDSKRIRIGEKDYHPVLDSKYALHGNTPLRPGYRKDFGYSLNGDAPTGWSRKIEAEIIDLKFAE